MPDELSTQYGGNLDFPAGLAGRPYIVANFASTLDGVVSFDIPGHAGGAQISGSNEADRFIMGLLRASADAVIVGASTVGAVSPAHLWIAEYVYPAAADAYARYRREILRKPAHPLIVIVSGRGNLDLNRSVFHTSGIQVLIVTSQFGLERLTRAGADKLPSTRTRELPANEADIDPSSIASLLEDELGAKLLLHEGGPTLFGRFLGSGLIDELFLTMAPQIAGRGPEDQRPGLVANALFHPGAAPWLSLISVKQQASHLYLRYRKIET
ncbi:MAG TPA: dihydrofolate reductase family protein [Bryobacteraceae bacterium]|nr:dihydrofolate reductase family protein [Bryobacteraceae bacterium]